MVSKCAFLFFATPLEDGVIREELFRNLTLLTIKIPIGLAHLVITIYNKKKYQTGWKFVKWRPRSCVLFLERVILKKLLSSSEPSVMQPFPLVTMATMSGSSQLAHSFMILS